MNNPRTRVRDGSLINDHTLRRLRSEAHMWRGERRYLCNGQADCRYATHQYNRAVRRHARFVIEEQLEDFNQPSD